MYGISIVAFLACTPFSYSFNFAEKVEILSKAPDSKNLFAGNFPSDI